jgi:hypothetical protein
LSGTFNCCVLRLGGTPEICQGQPRLRYLASMIDERTTGFLGACHRFGYARNFRCEYRTCEISVDAVRLESLRHSTLLIEGVKAYGFVRRRSSAPYPLKILGICLSIGKVAEPRHESISDRRYVPNSKPLSTTRLTQLATTLAEWPASS